MATALSPVWRNDSVWIHGDFSSANILVKDDRLAGVIDFGCMGVGDPACDLVIAWTLLTEESRKIFRARMDMDPDTWARARGWGLWKGLISLASLQDSNPAETLKHRRIIDEILKDHM